MMPNAVLKVLASGSWAKLEGVAEDGRIDFKSEPYKLDAEHGKYELAKDVAAFASGHERAVIVLGVQTEKPPDSPFEIAKRARGMPRQLINEKQYRDVIRSHVYPTVQGLKVTMYAAADDEEKCLLAILIPEQREQDRPFLVYAPLASDGSKVQGWLVGLPVRALDETEQMRESELHELISRGRNVAGRLDEIVVMLAHLQQPCTIESEAADSAMTYVTKLSQQPRTIEPDAAEGVPAIAEKLGALGQETAALFARTSDDLGGYYTAPVLYLAATPTSVVTIPTLFHETGVRQKLENPPVTRHEGWNLTTQNRAELVEGNRLSIRSGRRKLIELREDGTLVAVAPFERLLVTDRLDAGEPASKTRLKINSLGLVEFVHDFVLSYLDLTTFFEPQPEQACFLIGIDSAKSTTAGQLFLPPHGIESSGWIFADVEDHKPPDLDRFTWDNTTSLRNTNAGAIAYPLLERVYAFFKHTVDAIPYLNESRNAVDPETFSKTRRR